MPLAVVISWPLRCVPIWRQRLMSAPAPLLVAAADGAVTAPTVAAPAKSEFAGPFRSAVTGRPLRHYRVSSTAGDAKAGASATAAMLSRTLTRAEKQDALSSLPWVDAFASSAAADPGFGAAVARWRDPWRKRMIWTIGSRTPPPPFVLRLSDVLVLCVAKGWELCRELDARPHGPTSVAQGSAAQSDPIDALNEAEVLLDPTRWGDRSGQARAVAAVLPQRAAQALCLGDRISVPRECVADWARTHADDTSERADQHIAFVVAHAMPTEVCGADGGAFASALSAAEMGIERSALHALALGGADDRLLVRGVASRHSAFDSAAAAQQCAAQLQLWRAHATACLCDGGACAADARGCALLAPLAALVLEYVRAWA